MPVLPSCLLSRHYPPPAFPVSSQAWEARGQEIAAAVAALFCWPARTFCSQPFYNRGPGCFLRELGHKERDREEGEGKAQRLRGAAWTVWELPPN